MRRLTSRGLTAARERVYARENGVCWVCKRPTRPDEDWQLDHLITIVEGGSNEDWNLRIAHRVCNQGRRGPTNGYHRQWGGLLVWIPPQDGAING